MRRPRGVLAWAELASALLITAFIVFLIVRFSTHAGPLWRDEVSTVQLASRSPYAEVLRSLRLDSAPALYPTLLRLGTLPWSGGVQDGRVRVFGFGVATGIVGAIWVTGWVLGAGPPLLALTLFAAHAGMLQTAGMAKPYGLGSLLIMLAFGAIGRLVTSPHGLPLLYALVAAILAVQTLYHNAPLILAVCVAGVAVAAAARESTAALAVVGIGVAAAASLLPYTGVLLSSWDWRPLNHVDFDMRWLLAWSSGMLTEGNRGLAMLWADAAVLASYGTLVALRRSSRSEPGAAHRHAAYAALVIVCATGLYLGFLRLAGRIPQAWQFVPLIGVTALAIDVVLAGRLTLRWARLAVVLLVAVIAFPLSIDHVGIRQTNVDLIAQHLNATTRRGDLIVVSPWYLGITFNRYYRGPAEWMTVPPLEDHTVHRYDLIKLRMMSPEPLAPLYGAMQTALESGRRVWLVGGVPLSPANRLPPVLPPAPALPTGWSDAPYGDGWALQVGYFLQTHGERFVSVPIPVDGPVNSLESALLEMFEGWR